MAQKLRKNIEAAQNFLAGLQTLDIFQEMRLKQVIALENQIRKLPALGTQDAAVVVSILKDDVWGSQGHRLKEALAAKVSALEPKTSEAAGRRKLQDYLELPNFLTADIWDQLRSAKLTAPQRLDAICKHAVALGLRCPSEKTVAMLLALSHAMYQEPYEDEKLALVTQYRIRISKHMALPSTAEHLVQLPADPAELPSSIAAVAFAKGERVCAPTHLPNFRVMAEGWPVRTSKGGKEFDSKKPDDKISFEQFGHMMSGLVRAQTEQDKRENFDLKRSQSLLALEDWKGDEDPPAPRKEAQVTETQGEDAVAETLAALRSKVAESTEEDKKKRHASVLRL